MNTQIQTIQNDPLEGSSEAPVVLDPRQQLFIDLYCNTDSKTFGNCYQSALKAGYSHLTARNLMHLRPTWLSDSIGRLQGLEPEHLILKLTQIINNPHEKTQHKLKAIDMLMRHNRMYGVETQNNLQINIESVLA